jgi:hypothetical protein
MHPFDGPLRMILGGGSLGRAKKPEKAIFFVGHACH